MTARLSIFFLFTAAGLAAQPAGEGVFAGRVVDTEQRAVRGERVILIGVSEGRTDDDGLFRVSIPASLAEVQVELERYEVIYPRGGRAPVPKSAATPVLFEVKKLETGGQEKLIRQLRENLKKLENDRRFREEEIGRLEKSLRDTIATYHRLFEASGGQTARLTDSLQQRIESLLASRESALLAEKKEKLYGDISRTLLNFLDKAKNLRDELARVEDVFLSEPARLNFEKQVGAYNTARDSLYNLHRGYLESIRLFWHDPEAVAKAQNVYDLALVQIHEGIMLPLNGSVIGPVRDAATGRTSRLAARRKARQGASRTLEQLAFPLRNLELKISELAGILSH